MGGPWFIRAEKKGDSRPVERVLAQNTKRSEGRNQQEASTKTQYGRGCPWDAREPPGTEKEDTTEANSAEEMRFVTLIRMRNNCNVEV